MAIGIDRTPNPNALKFTVGKPVGGPVTFTAANAASPSSKPGPRKLRTDERLALSNEALKIIFTPCRSATSRTVRATPKTCSADSMTHGPAMRTSGAPPPSVMWPICTALVLT